MTVSCYIYYLTVKLCHLVCKYQAHNIALLTLVRCLDYHGSVEFHSYLLVASICLRANKLSCSAESSWWSAQRRTTTTSETSSSVSWPWPGSCPRPVKRLPWSGGPARTYVAGVAARPAPRHPCPRRAAAAPRAPSRPVPSPAVAPSSDVAVARPSSRSGTLTTASTTATSPRSHDAVAITSSRYSVLQSVTFLNTRRTTEVINSYKSQV